MTPYFFQMQVKQVEVGEDAKSVIIEGYASTPDLDRHGDIVEPAAFGKALELFMKNPVLLRSHNHDVPAGTVLSAVQTSKGLKIKAEVTEERTANDVKAGRMRAFSIGYMPKDWVVQHEDGTPFNPDTDSIWDDDLVRVLKELELVEISIVSVPANGQALFTVAKSLREASRDQELLIVKSMKTKKKNLPENEQEVVDTDAPSAEEAEVVETPPVEAPKTTEEVVVEEGEKAAEGESTDEPTEEKVEAPEPQEDAEKAGEVPAAASVEDTEESTEETTETLVEEAEESEEVEEAPTDAEPVAEGDETAPEDGEKRMLLCAKDIDVFPLLREAGVVAIAQKGQEAVTLDPAVKEVMMQMHSVIDALNVKLQATQTVLDKVPAKQALAPRGQFNEEMDTKTTKEAPGGRGIRQTGTPSVGFQKMFPGVFPNKT